MYLYTLTTDETDVYYVTDIPYVPDRQSCQSCLYSSPPMRRPGMGEYFMAWRRGGQISATFALRTVAQSFFRTAIMGKRSFEMARPRIPSNILELRGAYKSHPSRKRGQEPKPRGELGEPPEDFTKVEAKLWEELQRICAPGVLTEMDTWHAVLTVRLMAKFSANEATTSEIALLERCLSKLGMNPSDRSRVKVKIQPPKNKFDGL